MRSVINNYESNMFISGIVAILAMVGLFFLTGSELNTA